MSENKFIRGKNQTIKVFEERESGRNRVSATATVSPALPFSENNNKFLKHYKIYSINS